MKKDAIIKAARWIERAEEAKRMASSCTLPAARLQLLKIAETYSHMAHNALEWSDLPQPEGEGNGTARLGD